jgi:cytochrome c
MKPVLIALLIVLVAVLTTGMSGAKQHEASVDMGKALFNDAKLGTAGKSCGSCHADGKGLEKAGAGADLEKTINTCIGSALKGKALDAKSVEMQSLVLYIKSLKPAGKKPAVGC